MRRTRRNLHQLSPGKQIFICLFFVFSEIMPNFVGNIEKATGLTEDAISNL